VAFPALLLAHLLGDFPCQPYPLIRWKLASLRGLLVHVAIQTALALPVMIWAIPRWPLWLGVLSVSHFLIDWAKVRWTRGGWIELGAFFLDQSAHISVLWIIARASGAQLVLSAAAAMWLRVAIAFIAAVYAGSVVVFLTNAARTHPTGGFAPIPLGERVRGMVERGIVVVAFVALPSAILTVVLAAAYLAAAAVIQRDRWRWAMRALSVAWALAVTVAAV